MAAQPQLLDQRCGDTGVPAAARWLLAVVTLLAVLGMHALMGPGVTAAHLGGTAAHGTIHLAAGATAVAGPSSSTQHVPAAVPSMAGDAGCSAGHCREHGGHSDHGPLGGGHTLAHLCLAILAGAVAVLGGLALSRDDGLLWVIGKRLVAAGRGTWRAPPWTQLSLAQLSVLRV